MFAVRNATFRDGHHSFVARLMALTIRSRRANCGGLGEDDPQSLALVCMEPAGRGTVGSGKLAADDLVACEHRRAVDTGGVRNAAMATRCPRPWACSARRLGRLGRWLSRASPPASASEDLRRSLKIASSAAALGLRHRVSKPARSRIGAIAGFPCRLGHLLHPDCLDQVIPHDARACARVLLSKCHQHDPRFPVRKLPVRLPVAAWLVSLATLKSPAHFCGEAFYSSCTGRHSTVAARERGQSRGSTLSDVEDVSSARRRPGVIARQGTPLNGEKYREKPPWKIHAVK